MDTTNAQIAFTPVSSFTPKPRLSPFQTYQHSSISSASCNTLAMVAPKHVRRSEEIKRLTKQLQQLRAVRDQMKKEEDDITSSTPSTPPVAPPTSPKPSTPVNLGKHAEGSRFLSITDSPSDKFFPRILPVAGTVPGLTIAELNATPVLQHSKAPQHGNVFVTKLPQAYDGELIAMPMPENITEYIDPVVLKVQPAELSASQLPCAEDDYVFVVIDRGTADAHFDNTKFYAWDVDGVVKVGWMKTEPHETEARCLGKVLLGILEVRKDLRKKRSCWEEENETYG